MAKQVDMTLSTLFCEKQSESGLFKGDDDIYFVVAARQGDGTVSTKIWPSELGESKYKSNTDKWISGQTNVPYSLFSGILQDGQFAIVSWMLQEDDATSDEERKNRRDSARNTLAARIRDQASYVASHIGDGDDPEAEQKVWAELIKLAIEVGPDVIQWLSSGDDSLGGCTVTVRYHQGQLKWQAAAAPNTDLYRHDDEVLSIFANGDGGKYRTYFRINK